MEHRSQSDKDKISDKEKAKFKVGVFSKALYSLKEGAQKEITDEIIRDGVIQRFEFTYEAAVRATQAVLLCNGVQLRHPKEIFREAFMSGWITNADLYDDIVRDRNSTSHVYSEHNSKEVYYAIKDKYVAWFEVLLRNLTGQL